MNITEAAQNLLDYFPEELREITELRYRHALLRLKKSYPHVLGCAWTIRSHHKMVVLTYEFARIGRAIYAAFEAVNALRDRMPPGLVSVLARNGNDPDPENEDGQWVGGPTEWYY